MKNENVIISFFAAIIISFPSFGCNKNEGNIANLNDTVVHVWMTTPDKSKLLTQEPDVKFANVSGSDTNNIIVDESKVFQGIDGFGFCLTDNSAIVIDSLSPNIQNVLLNELFSTSNNGIGISYLRLPMGATSMSTYDYTFDEISSGTDYNLSQFSVQPDIQYVIPLLKKILAINPNISILATPWTPPTWMKSNHSFIGGTLNTSAFSAFADYFVKYIQAMKAQGINITAVTPQNEPNNIVHDPSSGFSASAEAEFIADYLGPAFKNAGLTTKIICFDHNASTPEYPDTVFSNNKASSFIDGSAYHLYQGDVSALSQIHDAFPDKNIYFTEQYTSTSGTFAGYLKSATKNLIIGATRNWSRNVLEWNLAADGNNGPKKADGCSDCLPAITITPTINRNISYYIIAHASKFVRPGASRIGSNIAGDIQNVAFKNPDGSKVLIVLNTGMAAENFNVVWQNKFLTYTLPQGAVTTLKW